MLHATVRREDLMKAAVRANAIAIRRTTMPILSNVLLWAEGDTLTVAASDLEVISQIRLPAEVIEPGRVTIPAKPLADISRSVAGELVVLTEGNNHTLSLTCGAFSSNIFGLAPENFPALPDPSGLAFVRLDSTLLSDAIAKTISSVTQGDDTFNLAGVLFLRESEGEGEFQRAKMRLVSTDTQRMSVATVDADGLDRLTMPTDLPNPPKEALPGVIVPTKGAQEIKAMTETGAMVEVGVLRDKLIAMSEESLVAIRLLDGFFPDYHRVIPAANELSAIFSRLQLVDALKRIAILTVHKDPLATFLFSRHLLTISAANP